MFDVTRAFERVCFYPAPRVPEVDITDAAGIGIYCSASCRQMALPAQMLVEGVPIPTATPAVQPPGPPTAAKPSFATHVVPLDDAYKALKATPGTTWEFVEQTRSTFVQQSHPSRWRELSAEKLTQVLAETNRVNAAYARLSRARLTHLGLQARAPPRAPARSQALQAA